MKWLKNTRKGSYIVEAAIVVPVFIISILMLITIIPVMAGCENVFFSACDEIHREAVQTAFRKNPAALPLSLQHRIKGENSRLSSFQIRFFRYLYTDEGIEDLMQIDMRSVFSEKNPIGLFSSVTFDGCIRARAFTGKLHKRPPGSLVQEDDQIVYIFPEWGTKYHGKRCTYVRASCQMVYLSQNVKKDYTPCKLCNASSARIGSPVFCFQESGRAYHIAGCKTVERYYIEIQRGKAKEQGYTPCSKCGGGHK